MLKMLLSGDYYDLVDMCLGKCPKYLMWSYNSDGECIEECDSCSIHKAMVQNLLTKYSE